MSHKLILVPNFLGEFSANLIPLRTIEVTHSITHFIVEKEKTARAFLKAIVHPVPQSDFVFCELNKHDNYSGFKVFFDKHIETHSIGLLSEAGLPAIADPGSEIVLYAHKKNVLVEPLAGSSSIFLALMGSGLSGQNFEFNGYLPIDKADRIKSLKQIELKSRNTTQIVMETPFRNNQFLEFLKTNLNHSTLLCVAASLETSAQYIHTTTIKEWQKISIDLNKRPCIYVIHA